jgi:hypothetical protein
LNEEACFEIEEHDNTVSERRLRVLQRSTFTPVNGVLHKLSRILQIELFFYMRAVSFHRFDAEMQLLGDLPGGASLPDQGENFQFAIAEILQR